jgi:hypothetical protein
MTNAGNDFGGTYIHRFLVAIYALTFFADWPELPVQKKVPFATAWFVFLLWFEFELPEIPCKSCLSLPIERWTIIEVFASLCNMGSKDHTCWLTALTTVSFGEQSQDFDHLWFWSTFETGLNCSSVLPGIVDFLSQPFNDFLSLRLVTGGLYADFPRMNHDQLPM